MATGLDRVEGECKLGEKRQDMPDHEQLSRCPCRLDHLVGRVRGERDGLFNQDVLARLECLNRHGSVRIVGNAKVDQIDIRIVEEIFEISVASEPGEIHLGATGTEITLDARPVARELPGIATAKGDDPEATGCARRRGSGSCP